jgi:hypothetical protein
MEDVVRLQRGKRRGRLGMGGSATGGGFWVVGVDDAEGGSDAVAGGDARLQQPAPHVDAIARGSTGRTAGHECRRCPYRLFRGRDGANPHLEGIFLWSRSSPAAPHPNNHGSGLAPLL